MKQAPHETRFEAIILCGGSAKRMKPYLPFNKALAEVTNGQTLLEYQINWLKRNGVNQIILAIDAKTYSDVSAFTPRILQEVQCSIENHKLGTGGAVRKAVEKVESPLVYVMNVDDIIVSENYSPQNLLQLTKKDIKGILLVTRTYFPFGVVETRDQYVCRFKKKPLLDYWINTGH
jgi:NDP-sugar pyrophosphorylase family protein